MPILLLLKIRPRPPPRRCCARPPVAANAAADFICIVDRTLGPSLASSEARRLTALGGCDAARRGPPAALGLPAAAQPGRTRAPGSPLSASCQGGRAGRIGAAPAIRAGGTRVLCLSDRLTACAGWRKSGQGKAPGPAKIRAVASVHGRLQLLKTGGASSLPAR